jgi:hypothetical protein
MICPSEHGRCATNEYTWENTAATALSWLRTHERCLSPEFHMAEG